MANISFGPFSLDVPIDWTLSTLILAGAVSEQPRTGGLERFSAKPFQQNLVATMEQVEARETAKSYVQRQIDGLRKAAVTRWEAAKPEEVALPNGCFGLITEQVVVGSGGDRVRQMQLVTIKNHVAYTLITTDLDGDPFEASRRDFRKMLLSFQ